MHLPLVVGWGEVVVATSWKACLTGFMMHLFQQLCVETAEFLLPHNTNLYSIAGFMSVCSLVLTKYFLCQCQFHLILQHKAWSPTHLFGCGWGWWVNSLLPPCISCCRFSCSAFHTSHCYPFLYRRRGRCATALSLLCLRAVYSSGVKVRFSPVLWALWWNHERNWWSSLGQFNKL